jgi:SAM-dependent methyltransferase
MKESLLPYLACPECAGDLSLHIEGREGAEIISGSLQCSACQNTWPVVRGVPRFADLTEVSEDKQATAKNFGEQWLEFDHVQSHHEQQFKDWIAPATPEFIRGKSVIEGGCGKGRHTRIVAQWGVRDVIGVDLSIAVEAAFQNTRDLPNAHIIQADIFKLPLHPVFDYAFSVGVLHHLPDPRGGFASLVSKLHPGGAITAWIYGLENNGWIVNFINPLREHITSRMPMRLLYYLSYIPSVILYLAAKIIYRPLRGTRFSGWLFYSEYISYISDFPLREIHNIVHDHLTAPTAFYISRQEFAEWYEKAQARNVVIEWHNRNSWRGFGHIGMDS